MMIASPSVPTAHVMATIVPMSARLDDEPCEGLADRPAMIVQSSGKPTSATKANTGWTIASEPRVSNMAQSFASDSAWQPANANARRRKAGEEGTIRPRDERGDFRWSPPSPSPTLGDDPSSEDMSASGLSPSAFGASSSGCQAYKDGLPAARDQSSAALTS
jgi:hypothetical protein